MQSTSSKLQSFDFDIQRKTLENRVQPKPVVQPYDSDLSQGCESNKATTVLGVEARRWSIACLLLERNTDLTVLVFYFITKKTRNNYGLSEPRKATEITTKEYISDDNYKFFAWSIWSNDERFIHVATLEPFVRPATSTEVCVTFLRQCWCLILIEWFLITIRNTSAMRMIISDRCRYIRIFLVLLKLGLHFTRTRNTFGLGRIKSVRFLLLG